MSSKRSTAPQSSLSRHAGSWLLLILANLLWASSYTAAKFVLRDTSVIMMNALRMGISALILLPVLFVGRGNLRLTRRDLPQLALLALVGFVVNKMLEFGGLSLTTASDVALLISGESIFTAVFSWLLLRERVRPLTVCALVLGVAGVYLIIERGVLPTLPSGGGVWRMVGDLLVLLALSFEAFYTVRGKVLLMKHSPLLITSAAIVGSVFFWIPLAGWSVLTQGWHPLSLVAWLGIGWLALGVTVIAYLSWFQGLTKVDGSAAASTLFIQPLLGTLLAVILLHDQLSAFTLLGGLLIIVSVYLISRQ